LIKLVVTLDIVELAWKLLSAFKCMAEALNANPNVKSNQFIGLTSPQQIEISGLWNANTVPSILAVIKTLAVPRGIELTLEASKLTDLDTAGAWVLQKFLHQVQLGANAEQMPLKVTGLDPQFSRLLTEVGESQGELVTDNKPKSSLLYVISHKLNSLGKGCVQAMLNMGDFLSFTGEAAIALGGWLAHSSRIRWRPILFNIRSAGFDALPIVSLLSMMLGVVVGYQGADQLVRYGASIFIADVVGLSMLREFAPLMTAIIIAGRSGSAYAAQIGTMAVTEEIDAITTMGIEPMDVLVLPKLIGLLIALPLLTVFADFLGVIGGMLMAQQKLGIGFPEFLDRFVKAVSVTSFMVGIAKAPVFALIIALVGCYQGFRTKGGADSVGQQTTKSVVQSVFLVIVVDAIFSVVFSKLDL
jgi:phospholipid/cholesterol/gamma-HCH transport system permease protein